MAFENSLRTPSAPQIQGAQIKKQTAVLQKPAKTTCADVRIFTTILTSPLIMVPHELRVSLSLVLGHCNCKTAPAPRLPTDKAGSGNQQPAKNLATQDPPTLQTLPRHSTG